MNGSVDRKIIAELIIMLAVCVGAWMIFVQPRVARFEELEVSIAEAERNPALASRNVIEEMAGRLHEIRDEVRIIDARNEFGRDSSEIYGLLMRLAKEHGVIVQRLDPGSTRTADDDDEPVEIASFHMSVEGKYRAVAAFLESILDIDGYVRPGSLNLTPIGQDGTALVSARFSCEALTFQIPDALAAIVEDDDRADE